MRRIPELKDGRRGAEWALSVGTAQELGLFGTLAEGPRPVDELARALALDPRGTSILVGVLERLDLVREDPEGVRLTGAGRARFVDRDTPDFEADALRLWLANIREWASDLPEAVRSGGRAGGTAAAEEDDPEATARFMAAMDNKDPALVRSVVERCVARLREAGVGPDGRVLDLGGGPGTFARALAERGLRVTLADRPEVVEHVRDRYGLSGVPGTELWAGDFLTELPEGPFHLVLAANITHIFDADTNAALILRLADRLAPGGVLALLDFVRGESDFAPLFALTMLLKTEGGNTYARVDYQRWLHDAGLEGVRVESVDEDRQLVTGRRPAHPAAGD